MRSPLALVLAVVACGGSDGAAVGPREPPVLRLVGCEPARPAPATLEPMVERRLEVSASSGARRARKRVEGRVSFGMPSTGGAIDAAIVRRILDSKLPALRACYEAELARSHQGRFSVAWRLAITQDGRVLHAMPTTHETSAEMLACNMRVMRSMVFPARATGGTVSVTLPLVFEAVTLPERARVVADDGRAWAPFGTDPRPHGVGAPSVARAAEVGVRARIDKLAACFPPAGPTGSLRAVLELDGDGELVAARAGGMGDRTVEACVERGLAGLAVVTPVPDAVEIACDLARGDAQSWRVAPAGGYGVIEASRERLRYRDQAIELAALEPEPLLDPKTYLVVADLDTPGAMLALALAWANEGDGAVIAVRDGTRAPLYVGMGRVAVAEGADGGVGVQHAALQLGARTLTACVGRAVQRAKLGDASAVGALLRRVAERCKATRCGPILALGLDPDAVARDLVEVTGAARRAGFERVLIGGTVPCGRDDDEADTGEEDG